jgi:hypothetical protein
MTARPALRRAAALVTVAALLAGCRSWQPTDAAPQSVAGPRARALRVTVRGLDALVLHEPRVVADSLVGMVDVAEGQPRARFAVPLADVERVDTRRFDAGLTVGAFIFAGSVVGAGVLVYRLRPGA